MHMGVPGDSLSFLGLIVQANVQFEYSPVDQSRAGERIPDGTFQSLDINRGQFAYRRATTS
jgi:hypothetical protein